jgi:thioredoxin-like negative regulator of GroEL
LAPVLDELATDYAGRVKFVVIDLDQNRLIASQNGVNGTPTLFFYKGGKLVDRGVGALPKIEIARRLNALIGTR